MKSLTKIIAITAYMSMLMSATACSSSPPHDVQVTYAFVPKDQLPEAVQSKTQAMHIETAWRDELAKLDPHNARKSLLSYCVVVFVEIPPRFALWGRIGIPVQNSKGDAIINVSLAPGHKGVYVVDGGGAPILIGGPPFASIPPNPKSYKWLEVHTQ